MPIGGKEKHACNLRIPKVSKKQVSREYGPLCDSAETQTHPNCLQSLVFTGWTFFEYGKHVKVQVKPMPFFKVTYLVLIKIIMQQKSARIKLPKISWSLQKRGLRCKYSWFGCMKWNEGWNETSWTKDLYKNGNSFKFVKQRFWSSLLKITVPSWDESHASDVGNTCAKQSSGRLDHPRRHSGSAFRW